MKDYTLHHYIGAGSRHSEALKPSAEELAAHLEAAIEHAEALGLYVNGAPFERTLIGIIGHLQRAGMVQIDSPTPFKVIDTSDGSEHGDGFGTLAEARTWALKSSLRLWEIHDNGRCVEFNIPLR